MKYEKQAFESLLQKVVQVFGEELKTLSQPQRAIVNGLVEDRIKARGGDPSKVTLDEVEGVRELLYEQFNLAAVLDGLEE